MLSRFGCVLGRFTPATTRTLVSPSVRALSTSLPRAGNDAPKPAVPSRPGLTGFLYDKTGVTGAWTLGVGLSAYCISKELYIINAETVTAVIIGGVIIWLMKKIGKPTAQFLDDRSQSILDGLNENRNVVIRQLEGNIQAVKDLETKLESRHEAFEILKENNVIQLEEEYRRRLHEVNREVKKRLDYQVDVEKLQLNFEQNHLLQWLEQAVVDSLKARPDESLTKCIADLRKMTAA